MRRILKGRLVRETRTFECFVESDWAGLVAGWGLLQMLEPMKNCTIQCRYPCMAVSLFMDLAMDWAVAQKSNVYTIHPAVW